MDTHTSTNAERVAKIAAITARMNARSAERIPARRQALLEQIASGNTAANRYDSGLWAHVFDWEQKTTDTELPGAILDWAFAEELVQPVIYTEGPRPLVLTAKGEHVRREGV